MLDQNQRRMVEDIKDAKTLKITVGGGKYDDYGDVMLTFDMSIRDIRKLRHDIALALQDYFNKANRDERWKQVTTKRNYTKTTASTARR